MTRDTKQPTSIKIELALAFLKDKTRLTITGVRTWQVHASLIGLGAQFSGFAFVNIAAQVTRRGSTHHYTIPARLQLA